MTFEAPEIIELGRADEVVQGCQCGTGTDCSCNYQAAANRVDDDDLIW